MRQIFQQRLFGIHLKRWREKYDFTQLEVAVHCRCSPGHIGRIENGSVQNFEIEVFLTIADMMDVDIREYFTERVSK